MAAEKIPQSITCFVVDVKVGEGLDQLLVHKDFHIKHALLFFVKIQLHKMQGQLQEHSCQSWEALLKVR